MIIDNIRKEVMNFGMENEDLVIKGFKERIISLIEPTKEKP